MQKDGGRWTNKVGEVVDLLSDPIPHSCSLSFYLEPSCTYMSFVRDFGIYTQGYPPAAADSLPKTVCTYDMTEASGAFIPLRFLTLTANIGLLRTGCRLR